jgi:hypothetical protein
VSDVVRLWMPDGTRRRGTVLVARALLRVPSGAADVRQTAAVVVESTIYRQWPGAAPL